jgi:hypothetical protein
MWWQYSWPHPQSNTWEKQVNQPDPDMMWAPGWVEYQLWTGFQGQLLVPLHSGQRFWGHRSEREGSLGLPFLISTLVSTHGEAWHKSGKTSVNTGEPHLEFQHLQRLSWCQPVWRAIHRVPDLYGNFCNHRWLSCVSWTSLVSLHLCGVLWTAGNSPLQVPPWAPASHTVPSVWAGRFAPSWVFSPVGHLQE